MLGDLALLIIVIGELQIRVKLLSLKKCVEDCVKRGIMLDLMKVWTKCHPTSLGCLVPVLVL